MCSRIYDTVSVRCRYHECQRQTRRGIANDDVGFSSCNRNNIFLKGSRLCFIETNEFINEVAERVQLMESTVEKDKRTGRRLHLDAYGRDRE
jgi:hypothetical protein